jgi:hypothetical protein
MCEHTPTDANAAGLSAQAEIHLLPNTFPLAFANRHYRAIRLTCTHVEPDRGTLEKVVALNLTLDE